jgi:hypothetical protein
MVLAAGEVESGEDVLGLGFGTPRFGATVVRAGGVQHKKYLFFN